MAKKLPRCHYCGEPIVPDRYNGSRQKYCKRAACKAERKRRRQRRSYNRRRATDAAFRESENARCAEANRRRRAAGRNASQCPPDPADMTDVVTGLLSQVTDTTDPVHLQNCLRIYAERGRRLTASAPTGTDPP